MNTNKQRPGSSKNTPLNPPATGGSYGSLPESGRGREGWSVEEEVWLSEQQRHLRSMISRALVAYLVLFLGLGIVMSLFGLDPLIKGGLMPKALFLFVGLSLLIAVTNTVVDASKEQEASWFNVLRSLVRRRPSSKEAKHR